MKRRNTPAKEAVLNVLVKTSNAMSQDTIEQKIEIDINQALHRIVSKDGKQYFALYMKCDGDKKRIHDTVIRCNKL